MLSFLVLPNTWKERLFKFWSFSIFVLVLVVSLTSLGHLEKTFEVDQLNFSVEALGWLWWGTVFLAITYLGRNHSKELIFIFMAFFLVGYFLGPYLEPPADPLEHLRRVYSYCGLSSNDIPRSNQGFWHYPMSGSFLCNEYLTQTPTYTLRTIDFLHGMYQGMLMSALFVVGTSSGLPSRWSFFAAFTAFLFFGTNKFSFFSYYSLAASASSILIYWLWVAAFFFKKNGKSFLSGTLFVFLSLPILWVNHTQEAAFLGLVFVIWAFFYFHTWIWGKLRYILRTKKQSFKVGKIIYLFILLMIFVVLPQFSQVYEWVSDLNHDSLSVFKYNWRTNQYLLLHWIPFYPVGDFIGHRVSDSLGIMGFLPILIAVPLLFFKPLGTSIAWFRIVVLSLLPLVVLFIPLLSSIWIFSLKAATAADVYWRVVYSSFYWMALATVLFKYEYKLPVIIDIIETVLIKKFGLMPKQWLKSLYSNSKVWFLGCLLILVALASVRSFPIYGKLDFIMVNARPWWDEWKEMVDHIQTFEQPVYTDHTSSIVLYDIFNYPSAHAYIKSKKYRSLSLRRGEMDVKKMNDQKEYQCVINLKGFDASWVPKETRHWQHTLSQTSLQYSYEGIIGDKLKDRLQESDVANCLVYK